MEFFDDGSTLWVVGEAEGLTPGHIYESLVYDIGSVHEGPDACEPTIFDPSDPNNILATMFLGFWTVDPDGNGTFFETNTTPLDKIGTVSIRDVAINGGMGPEAVVACGEVEHDEHDDDDDDDD